MLPPLPRNPMERQKMWEHGDEDLLVGYGNPMEPASHLDVKAQRRIALFPEMSGFLRSRFGLSRKTDQFWFPVRPLGKGGFGGVAVWEKRDFLGDVLEETAVKQTNWSRSMALRTEPRLAQEAAIMQQLNKKGSENIVYLKGFKCFKEGEGRKMTWRFYFEYCPYGDLSRLGNRYKAWGTYLPEEFLWKAFHSMALVAQIMDDGKYKNIETGADPPVPFTLVHSDIKPLNIFLGYNAEPDSPWYGYPVVKVGDWGLARLTNAYDPKNPQSFIKNGTVWYLPPESRPTRDTEKYAQWASPPFILDMSNRGRHTTTEQDPNYTNRKVDSSHNVWAFGLTIHELLTHESARIFSQRLDAMTEDQYVAWEHNSIPFLFTNRQPEYSSKLRQLVMRCLSLRPSLRPTPQEILEVTGPMVGHYEDELAKSDPAVRLGIQQDTAAYQLPKLYFKANEINHMPLGPHLADFGVDDKHQAAFAVQEDKYAGPVWGPIQHPNRAQWAHRYQKMIRNNRQKEENASRKTVHDKKRQQLLRVPEAVNDRLPPQAARRPPRRGSTDQARAHFRVEKPRVQQGAGQGAIINKPHILDAIDRALLASNPDVESDEQSRKHVRVRRRRLCDGLVPVGPELTEHDPTPLKGDVDGDISMEDASWM